MGLKETLKPFRHLGLLVRVEVGVGLQSGFYIFMPQPFTDQQWGEPHLNQQAGMAVTEMVTTRFDSI